MKSNDKKLKQLGMSIGTASAILRKDLLFSLVKELNRNYCFQCGNEIESVDDFSIEHKIPYLDSDKPIELFFDLNNVTYSHLSCNIGARRKRIPRKFCSKGHSLTDDNTYTYPNGTRICKICRDINRKNFRNSHRY